MARTLKTITAEDLFGSYTLRQPLVVANGLGVDSTAMLVGMRRENMRPDLILHADVGGEKDETVAYKAIIDEYTWKHWKLETEVVRYVPQSFKHWPPYQTLEQNCLTNGTLPSISFNYQFKNCSAKWKAGPQHKRLQAFAPAREWWNAGGQVLKAIGYDASPADERRRTYACNDDEEDTRYEYWYPLQDWGWTRDRCIAEIQAEGLPVPQKSSCFFCASMHPEEVEALPADRLRRIVRLEARALPRLVSIKGLWGSGSANRPGSMTQYILDGNLLPTEEVERIQAETPTELVPYHVGRLANQ